MGGRTGSRPRQTALARVISLITRLEIAAGAVALVVLFLLVFTQAAQRYLPVDGWSWTGELARFCLVWLTFTVAGVLVTTDSHISLQLVDTLRKPAVVRAVRAVACLIVALVGLGFAAEAWALIGAQGPLKSPSMRMPLAWLYVLPLLGFLSTAVRGAVAAVDIALHGVPTDGKRVHQ
jgi:TRAP-type C4-dicarboxylate transport system permease small subunit